MKMLVDDVISVIGRANKIKSSEYKLSGKYPVIDQGENFISGYIDDEGRAITAPLPVIVFGDHTCKFKFVNFPFAAGADGIQIIVPKDPEQFDICFLYYSLLNLPIQQFGYQRHMKYLRSSTIEWRPLEEQKIIGKTLHRYEQLVQLNLRRIDSLRAIQRCLMAPMLKATFEIPEGLT